jgi:hypothetical protein
VERFGFDGSKRLRQWQGSDNVGLMWYRGTYRGGGM